MLIQDLITRVMSLLDNSMESIRRHKSLIDHLQQNNSRLLAMKSSRHLITFRDLRLRTSLPKRFLINVEHSHPLLDIYRHRKNVNDETMCETD